jgi:hypothetical protein
MKKRIKSLTLIQWGWPICAFLLILGSFVLPIAAGDYFVTWSGNLPSLVGLVVMMGTCAAGGPALADHEKRKAGIFGTQESSPPARDGS